MKKIFLILTLMVVAVSFNLVCFAQDVVYVDLFELFTNYKKTEDYDKVLEEKQGEKEKGLQTLKDEIGKLQEEFNLVKESEKEKKKKEIEEKAGDFDAKRREAFLDLKKARDEKMKEILKDIEEVVERYAKKNRLTMVLKKAAVAYGDRKFDKTDEILKILNKEYKK